MQRLKSKKVGNLHSVISRSLLIKAKEFRTAEKWYGRNTRFRPMGQQQIDRDQQVCRWRICCADNVREHLIDGLSGFDPAMTPGFQGHERAGRDSRSRTYIPRPIVGFNPRKDSFAAVERTDGYSVCAEVPSSGLK